MYDLNVLTMLNWDYFLNIQRYMTVKLSKEVNHTSKHPLIQKTKPDFKFKI